MQTPAPTDLSLDELAVRARAGEHPAETTLFEALRVRFLDIAKRRVRRDDLEDVVQETLQIVHAKYGNREHQPGMLTWSLAVLRNVIGNYYQKRERLDRGEPFEERLHSAPGSLGGQSGAGFSIPGSDPLGEFAQQVLKAISLLAEKEPRCGVLFRKILESLDMGGGQREISRRVMERLREDHPGASRGSLYVALHRCRTRLREIIREMDGSGRP